MTTDPPVDAADAAPSAGTNARAAGRESMMLLATLRLPGGEEKARVRNLSAGGMMVDLATTLPPGTRVEIELPRIGGVAGAVAWSKAGRTGFRFESAVDVAKARRPIGGGEGSPVYSKSLTVGPRALKVR